MQERVLGNESVFGERPVNKKAIRVIRPVFISVFSLQFGAASLSVIRIPKHGVHLARPDETGHTHKSPNKFVSAVKCSPPQASLSRAKRI
jgi:hypothetical protein